jgi:hypothetical protein
MTSLYVVSGALALAAMLAGCGNAVSAARHADDLETKRFLARVKCPKTTLTIEQLGETYSEDAWAVAKKGFKPVYSPITEADAFEWEYLREIQARRRGLFAKQDKIDAAKRKKAEAAEARERKRKARADAKATAEARKAEAVENAELKPAVTAPGAAPLPSE